MDSKRVPRMAFMGTAALACSSLEALVAQADWSVHAVVTQPDRPQGRRLRLQPSPVKETALRLGLPVLQPERARHKHFLEELRSLDLDLIIVAAYGQILSAELLAIPRRGCVNVHTSLLPRHRGAAPIQWAILCDDRVTGVTIMQMDEGLDTGPILARWETDICEDDDAVSLHDRLAREGARLLVRTIPDYLEGSIKPQVQPEEGATYARKIKKEDGLLDWTQPARALWNRVRGLVPWPGAFTFWSVKGTAKRVKVWHARVEIGTAGEPGQVMAADESGILVACGEEGIRLTEVQVEGGKRVTANAFRVGYGIEAGQQFLMRGQDSG